jgi:hypothetical protein
MATKAVYGEDLLAAAGIDWKPYIKLIGERPSAQRVVADRRRRRRASRSSDGGPPAYVKLPAGPLRSGRLVTRLRS